MSNDPNPESSSQPTEASTRPKDYASEVDVDPQLRSDVHQLYTAVTADGSNECIENIRLTFRVPNKHASVGSWSERPSWLLYRCAVSGKRFAVPENAPVPVLAADKLRSNGDGSEDSSRLRTKIIHPGLVYDKPQLIRKLVWALDMKIRDLLYDLCEAFDHLNALAEMDELPDSGAADPYPLCCGERRGYVAVDDRGSACSG